MEKKLLRWGVLLALLTSNVSGETITLQQGADGYNGVTDRAVVDTYNFKKTDWLIAADSYSGDHRKPDQPGFAIAFFTC